jgi:hypothetical protein
MPTEQPKLLEELIHWCTRCKLNLNHRIIRVDDGVPRRVLCLTCQTDRVYRPKSLSSRNAAMGKAAAAQAVQEEQWRDKIKGSKRSPKTYTMEETFKLEDLVAHDKFGIGLATEFISNDKVRVFFDEGVKVLKCGGMSK